MLTLNAALEEACLAIDRVDALVLAGHVLRMNRAALAANPMRFLSEGEDARYASLVAQRALGQPVAYLLGRREFYSREFAVGPAVLIPRPETETLVEAALARLPATHLAPPASRGPLTLLDLGTGSGAVGLTIACERPDVRVTATDTSAQALEVARGNAEALGTRVELCQGAWYEPVAARRFDMVVSNPPYVARGDPHLGQGDLRFEPPVALTDGSVDGLASIRAIAAGAPSHLSPGGWLLLEHGYDQAGAVAEVLALAGFTDLVSIPDLAGIPRVAGGMIAA
ncbi:MAG TPA: peptide chain release factor N(5)-glutamine methyltransferase [Usitatibacter sp.]|nr:peptide chain release factor N(5)-glutamine methyltransferase [Usitatibacter sp.]